MLYYIECFYADGTQILGNGCGQATMRCKNFRHTRAYRDMCAVMAKKRVWPYEHVASARVVDETGKTYKTLEARMK